MFFYLNCSTNTVQGEQGEQGESVPTFRSSISNELGMQKTKIHSRVSPQRKLGMLRAASIAEKLRRVRAYLLAALMHSSNKGMTASAPFHPKISVTFFSKFL